MSDIVRVVADNQSLPVQVTYLEQYHPVFVILLLDLCVMIDADPV